MPQEDEETKSEEVKAIEELKKQLADLKAENERLEKQSKAIKESLVKDISVKVVDGNDDEKAELQEREEEEKRRQKEFLEEFRTQTKGAY